MYRIAKADPTCPWSGAPLLKSISSWPAPCQIRMPTSPEHSLSQEWSSAPLSLPCRHRSFQRLCGRRLWDPTALGLRSRKSASALQTESPGTPPTSHFVPTPNDSWEAVPWDMVRKPAMGVPNSRQQDVFIVIIPPSPFFEPPQDGIYDFVNLGRLALQ